MANFISEDQIEKAAVKLLREKYEYRSINCYTSDLENTSDQSNRKSQQEVVFLDILKDHAVKLNPSIPETIIDNAIEKLTSRRYAISQILANKEIYNFIRDGISVFWFAMIYVSRYGAVR